jgi:hypothetical protein
MVRDAAKLRLPVITYPIKNVLITAISLQVRDLANDLFLLTNLT